MACWIQAQKLPPESLQQIHAIYTDCFPLEVRHVLATWIEDKMWAQEPEDNRRLFVEELIAELMRSASQMVSQEMFVVRMKLLKAAEMFREKYSHAPLELFAYVQNCLEREVEVIRAATPYMTQPPMPHERKYSEDG